MIGDGRETRENSRQTGDVSHRKGGPPRVPMLFSATAWTFNVRLGRSGREEGEGIIIMGEVSYRAPGGERRVYPGRAMVVKSDARKRLDLVLSPQEVVLTIPLEPFAMQRLQDRLKDLVSGYGMAVRIGFQADDVPERQALETVDFAFSSASRSSVQQRTAQTAAQANER
jgi:hypothetical protein